MSKVAKRPYDQMYRQAYGLMERLQPACERIEIAGSIRRRRPLIGDIEFVLMPRYLTDLFGQPTGQTELDLLLAGWPITRVKDGQKYKQISFAGNSGQPYTVDLWIQSKETWGVNLMIRTGSEDFTKRMVTRRVLGGYMPNDLRVDGARVWRNGAPVDTPEEEDVFHLFGVEWVRPEERN